MPRPGQQEGAPLSRLKYWVVVRSFMTHDCWSLIKFQSKFQGNKVLSKTKLFQDENKKTMVNRIKSFFNIHGYKKVCNIEITANFNYFRNQSTTFFNKSDFYIKNYFRHFLLCNVGKVVFNLFETALDKIFVSTFNKEISLQFFIQRLSRSFLQWAWWQLVFVKYLKFLYGKLDVHFS